MLNDATAIPQETLAECLVLQPVHLTAASAKSSRSGIRKWLALSRDVMTESTLRLAVRMKLEGIVLTGACTGPDVQKLHVTLSVAEALEEPESEGRTRIAALAADDPEGIFALPGFAGLSERLDALGGGGDALRKQMRLPSAATSEPLRQARGLVVLGAARSNVMALAGLESGLDTDAFANACRQDVADGFHGRMVATAAEAAIANVIFPVQTAVGR